MDKLLVRVETDAGRRANAAGEQPWSYDLTAVAGIVNGEHSVEDGRPAAPAAAVAVYTCFPGSGYPNFEHGTFRKGSYTGLYVDNMLEDDALGDKAQELVSLDEGRELFTLSGLQVVRFAALIAEKSEGHLAKKRIGDIIRSTAAAAYYFCLYPEQTELPANPWHRYDS